MVGLIFPLGNILIFNMIYIIPTIHSHYPNKSGIFDKELVWSLHNKCIPSTIAVIMSWDIVVHVPWWLFVVCGNLTCWVGSSKLTLNHSIWHIFVWTTTLTLLFHNNDGYLLKCGIVTFRTILRVEFFKRVFPSYTAKDLFWLPIITKIITPIQLACRIE